ncbi:unnamed protein product, partial [Ectocarpus sp. 6 AP-2014]
IGRITLAIPTGGPLMANSNSGCCGGGVDGDLTPLGQRRSRLPLQRKVKQLERPWKHTDAGAQVITPHHPTWASSQPVSKDGRYPDARPRTSTPVARKSRASVCGVMMRTSVSAKSVRPTGCGTTARTRPSTGSSPSSSRLLSPAWSTSEPVLLSTTRTTDTAEPAVEPGIAFIRGCGYRLDPGRRGDNEGAVGNKRPVQISTDATLTSAISSPSLLAAMSVTTTGPAASTEGDGGDPDDKIVGARQVVSTPLGSSNKNGNDDEEDSNSKNNPSVESARHVSSADAVAHCAARRAAKRPNSAAIARASSLNPLAQRAKTNVRRPRTAGCSRGHAVDPYLLSDDSAVIGRSITSVSFRPDLEKEGCAAVANWENEGSSIECRPSVSVTLPMLEDCNDTRDRRFSPGSATETSTREELGVDSRPSCSTVNCGPEELNTAQRERPGEPRRLGVAIAQSKAGLDNRKNEALRHSGENCSSRDPLLGTHSPHISALGYFIEEPRPQAAPSASPGLHGRALFGSNHRRPRSSPSRPPLPPPPAITPGEQPYGDAHPLSPTSMGSPPRRHRNSNWGEEGARLAAEEAENARQTIPFVVSGTLLGWKLSTRERKKSLEDSLKASDYSEHHLIPVYGFRSNDDREQEDDPGGTEEGDRRDRTMGVEERRKELRRVEARALAAERASMERRSRAEGGAGGAAFARAMSRRALARAEWIQKMGDVLDVRKENVCRGSSPEVLCAYRKRVRNRLNGERLRQRTARGLPSRKPPRISAVTSRADFPSAAAKNKAQPAGGRTATDDNDNDHGANNEQGDGCRGGGGGVSLIQDELGREPYLMLVRARSRYSQEQELSSRGGGSNKKSVASTSISARFCSDCVGGCKGTCSPDGARSSRSRSCSTGIVAEGLAG